MSKKVKGILFSLSFVVATGASADAAIKALEVSNHLLMKDFPSVSGTAVDQQNVFLVGDDFPWLYTVGETLKFKHKELIKNFPINQDGRINKEDKPDFEAMEIMNINGHPSLVIIGSGSKDETRELAYVIREDNYSKIEFSLKSLYEQLYQAGMFKDDGEGINIEGIASGDSDVYILNRGNGGKNIIFTLPKKEFEQYLLGKIQKVKNIIAYPVKLPVVDGFEAGLSGATYDATTKSLLFTASVEATYDTINDGKILGSFVGSLPVSHLVKENTLDLTGYSQMINKNGKPILTKVESISILSADEKKIKCLLASDNDNGSSEFFTVLLNRI
ncbi:DUF6929 family protein [Hafnia paralvei]|uniref:DUF6929 family protein n=1 Tax=Hafnia paralvei TaxID=546367 RepID=UPI001034B7A2|nr:hypothetical protein [Hafnia paralvei]TBL66011.1 hypothetical protein EYY97_00095 [Hafnia paralvei]